MPHNLAVILNLAFHPGAKPAPAFITCKVSEQLCGAEWLARLEPQLSSARDQTDWSYVCTQQSLSKWFRL